MPSCYSVERAYSDIAVTSGDYYYILKFTELDEYYICIVLVRAIRALPDSKFKLEGICLT